MRESASESSAFTPLRVMLVDLDPIFRLGLKTCLDESSEFEVWSDFGRSSEILQRLETIAPVPLDDSSAQASALDCPVDVLIWAVDIRHAGQPMTVGLPQLVRSRYPTLPICVLLGQVDSWLLQELRQSGVEGCWLKDANQIALLAAIRQIAAGQIVWDARLLNQLQPQQESTRNPLQTQAWTLRIRQRLAANNLRQLEAEQLALERLLAGPGLGLWERLVLEGRLREMRAARWWVESVLLPPALRPQTQSSRSDWPASRDRERQSATSDAVVLEPEAQPTLATDLTANVGRAMPTDSPTGGADYLARRTQTAVLSENQFQTYKSVLIEAIIAKLQTGLPNLTSEPLEIDILNAAKRQELFFILLRLIEETLDDLRFAQVTPDQIGLQRSRILLELWQRATADFFGKYVTLPATERTPAVELVPLLLTESTAVETLILAKIPMVESWLSHLLFQSPLLVENQTVVTGSPEAMRQSEAILENLMVRLANAVIAPLLNQAGTSELIKQTFYDRRWISTRELERFRNALSWNYRMMQFFAEPKQIFESQVPLMVLTETGIRRQEIYTPRDLELQKLRGIPLMVTLALEARDAVSPPLRATFTWVGRGVVYVLTQVVGRGIGLIGRGILQGVGSAWQENRQNPRSSTDRPDV